MSKVSAMQAMREARYAAARTPRPAAPVAEVAPAGRPVAAPVEQSAAAVAAVAGSDTPDEALCGHRSMNNRNCRRPAGHPEKNHRYS